MFGPMNFQDPNGVGDSFLYNLNALKGTYVNANLVFSFKSYYCYAIYTAFILTHAYLFYFDYVYNSNTNTYAQEEFYQQLVAMNIDVSQYNFYSPPPSPHTHGLIVLFNIFISAYTFICCILYFIRKYVCRFGPVNYYGMPFSTLLSFVDHIHYLFTSTYIFYPSNSYSTRQYGNVVYTSNCIINPDKVIVSGFCYKCYIYGHTDFSHQLYQYAPINYLGVYHNVYNRVFNTCSNVQLISVNDCNSIQQSKYNYDAVPAFFNEPISFLPMLYREKEKINLLNTLVQVPLPTSFAIISDVSGYGENPYISIDSFKIYINTDYSIPHTFVMSLPSEDIRANVFSVLNTYFKAIDITLYDNLTLSNITCRIISAVDTTLAQPQPYNVTNLKLVRLHIASMYRRKGSYLTINGLDQTISNTDAIVHSSALSTSIKEQNVHDDSTSEPSYLSTPSRINPISVLTQAHNKAINLFYPEFLTYKMPSARGDTSSKSSSCASSVICESNVKPAELLPEPAELLPEPAELLPEPAELLPEPAELLSELAELPSESAVLIPASNTHSTLNISDQQVMASIVDAIIDSAINISSSTCQNNTDTSANNSIDTNISNLAHETQFDHIPANTTNNFTIFQSVATLHNNVYTLADTYTSNIMSVFETIFNTIRTLLYITLLCSLYPVVFTAYLFLFGIYITTYICKQFNRLPKMLLLLLALVCLPLASACHYYTPEEGSTLLCENLVHDVPQPFLQPYYYSATARRFFQRYGSLVEKCFFTHNTFDPYYTPEKYDTFYTLTNAQPDDYHYNLYGLTTDFDNLDNFVTRFGITKTRPFNFCYSERILLQLGYFGQYVSSVEGDNSYLNRNSSRPVHLYFSDTYKFASTVNNSYTIYIGNEPTCVQYKLDIGNDQTFDTVDAYGPVSVLGSYASKNYLLINPSCFRACDCFPLRLASKLATDEPKLLNFTVNAIRKLPPLRHYRDTFLHYAPHELALLTNSFILNDFVYDRLDNEPCQPLANNLNKCLFRASAFDLYTCQNNVGMQFQCLSNDINCIYAAKHFCGIKILRPTIAPVKAPPTIIDTAKESLDNVIKDTKATIKEAISEMPTLNRLFHDYGFTFNNKTCNYYDHPDTKYIYNLCMQGKIDVTISCFNIRVKNNQYFIDIKNLTLNSSKLLSTLENSIGYTYVEIGTEHYTYLANRKLFYQTDTYVLYFPPTSNIITKWMKAHDYTPFTDKNDSVTVITGIFFFDHFISSFSITYITFLIVNALVIYFFLDNNAKYVDPSVCILRILILGLISFIAHYDTTIATYTFFSRSIWFLFKVDVENFVYTYLIFLFLSFTNLYQHYLQRRYLRNFYIIIFLDIIQSLISFILLITYASYLFAPTFCLAILYILYYYWTYDPNPWNYVVTGAKAKQYVDSYKAQIGARTLEEARKHLNNTLAHVNPIEDAHQARYLDFISQCFDHLESASSDCFIPRMQRPNFYSSLINVENVRSAVESISGKLTNNSTIKPEAHALSRPTIAYDAFPNIDPRRIVLCTYNTASTSCSLNGFCDILDGTPVLYIIRHIFGSTLDEISKPEWDRLTVASGDKEMLLDYTQATMNNGFWIIPYSNYYNFNPIPKHKDALTYTGPVVGLIANKIQIGYADKGRHNLNTRPGDCGSIILTAKSELLGLHVASQTVRFVDDVWSRIYAGHSTVINYFTALDGSVASSIQNFDISRVSAVENRPVIDPNTAIQVLTYLCHTVSPHLRRANSTWCSELEAKFGITQNMYKTAKANIDYKLFISNLNEFITSRYPGNVSLITLFLYGIDRTTNNNDIINESFATSCKYSVFRHYLNVCLQTCDISFLYTVFPAVTKLMNYDIGSWYFSVPRHPLTFNILFVFQFLQFFYSFFKHSTSLPKGCLALVILFLRIFVLYLWYTPGCTSAEDTYNLQLFKTIVSQPNFTSETAPTDFYCFDKDGYSVSLDYLIETDAFTNNWVSLSGYAYAIDIDASVFAYFRILGFFILNPITSLTNIINNIILGTNYEYACNIPNVSCSLRLVHLAFAHSNFFVLFYEIGIFTLIGFYLYRWFCIVNFTYGYLTYYFDLFYSYVSAYIPAALKNFQFTEYTPVIIESAPTLLRDAEYEAAAKYLQSSCVEFAKILKVLVAYPQFTSIKGMVDYFEKLAHEIAEAQSGNTDFIITNEHVTQYLSVVNDLKLLMQPFLDIFSQLDQRGDLMRTVLTKCFSADTLRIDTSAAESLAAQLATIFSKHNSSAKSDVVIETAITTYTVLEQLFPAILNEPEYDVDVYVNLLQNITHTMASADMQFAEAVHSYYREYISGIDDYLATIKDTVDKPRDFNIIKSKIDAISSRLRKLFNNYEAYIQGAENRARKELTKRQNQEQEQQRRELVNQRKAENIARALVTIITYINTLDVSSQHRLSELKRLLSAYDCTKLITTPVVDANNVDNTDLQSVGLERLILENFRYGTIFASESFSYLPMYCGKVLRCDATHTHSLNSCYNNLARLFYEHTNDTGCSTCLRKYVSKDHIVCSGTYTGAFIRNFNDYLTRYHACPNCILCSDCSSNNFKRSVTCRSSLAHFQEVTVASETFVTINTNPTEKDLIFSIDAVGNRLIRKDKVLVAMRFVKAPEERYINGMLKVSLDFFKREQAYHYYVSRTLIDVSIIKQYINYLDNDDLYGNDTVNSESLSEDIHEILARKSATLDTIADYITSLKQTISNTVTQFSDGIQNIAAYSANKFSMHNCDQPPPTSSLNCKRSDS